MGDEGAGMAAATCATAVTKRWPSATFTSRSKWWVRRRLRYLCLVVGIFAATVPLVLWIQEPPKRAPRFEAIVDETPGPVHDFSLNDFDGVTHSIADWAERPAIVLFFLSTKCPITEAYVPEMARLARKYMAGGTAFYGIVCDPELPEDSSAAALPRSLSSLPFPLLHDPDQRVARQVAVRVSPEVVVLAPDGQVLYRGRIDDRYSPGQKPRLSPRAHELEDALEAVLADELPTVSHTHVSGSKLPPRRPAKPGSDEMITFNRQVAPILWKHCAKCHRPGAVGPFSLLTYKDAAKRADFIHDVVASGQMPPWKPVAGAGVFRDAPRLSSLEIETLERWAASRRAEGDPADLPPQPTFHDGWQLGTPDVVVRMPEPFKIPPSGKDIYWAFALPLNMGRDMVIRGIEFRPGNRRVVHHTRLYLDPTGDARRRDLADPEPGFLGFIGPRGTAELPYSGLGGWTPGMTPRFAPSGVGRLVPDGADLVLRVHYHTTGKPEEDQSTIGLFASKAPVTRQMAGYTLCTDKINIPPGTKRKEIIISSWVKADVRLYAVVPHAHYLCREFRLAATLADGTTQPLLWIKDWDLDWQDQYRYLKPVRLRKGTLLTLAVYFDNSDQNPRNPSKPPRAVHYGLGTDDEMCACHLELLPDNPSGYKAYPAKSPFGL
jgi:peroxiredoxin